MKVSSPKQLKVNQEAVHIDFIIHYDFNGINERNELSLWLLEGQMHFKGFQDFQCSWSQDWRPWSMVPHSSTLKTWRRVFLNGEENDKERSMKMKQLLSNDIVLLFRDKIVL